MNRLADIMEETNCLNLFWLVRGDGPIIIIVHGLEGDQSSNNVKAMFNSLSKIGWNGVLLLNRNCGGIPNRLQKTYHAGDTSDLDFVVNHIKNRFPKLATPPTNLHKQDRLMMRITDLLMFN